MQGYLCHSKAVQLNSIKIAVGGSNLVGIFPLREAGEVMRAAASPAFMVIRSKKSEPQKVLTPVLLDRLSDLDFYGLLA